MTEKERILSHNNGELPEGNYDIVRAINLPNPEDELNTFKQTMLVFLENQDLDEEDPKWEILLPQKLVQFTNQLEEQDYHNDDMASHIPAILDKLKRIRKWEWYSSRLIENGFEVIILGQFKAIFIPLLHHQGIPHKSLFIVRDNIAYPSRVVLDVLSYKTFDPVTYELKRK